ncbi:hypothetical protein BJ878DRAFT_497226 [Calycina marina]|uniref:EF-hand domain-containing protein n=1 Tax=Calycina marina TaxID=1763456 RepID=A0A9P7Z6W5_9HELO|nr:hypothetical protein BJ878DRAFT_497226 [Calycina marina]
MATSYKPSPLSYGSPRASPFRRPESPHSPSPLRHQATTPTMSPTKTMMPTTPSQLASHETVTPSDSDKWTSKELGSGFREALNREREGSPTRSAGVKSTGTMGRSGAMADNNAMSKLQPAQVRELREGFQVLDRDSDGQVGREDVADMLTQLGLPANSSDITAFFPPSTPQTLNLPAYMHSIATLLAALSPSSELTSAFSAFDEDDSGQIDLTELRDALLHTAPEQGEKALTEREIDRIMNGFTGRRAFQKYTGGGMGHGKKGEVFKYQEFVAGVAGGASADGKGEREDEE